MCVLLLFEWLIKHLAEGQELKMIFLDNKYNYNHVDQCDPEKKSKT